MNGKILRNKSFWWKVLDSANQFPSPFSPYLPWNPKKISMFPEQPGLGSSLKYYLGTQSGMENEITAPEHLHVRRFRLYSSLSYKIHPKHSNGGPCGTKDTLDLCVKEKCFTRSARFPGLGKQLRRSHSSLHRIQTLKGEKSLAFIITL